MSEAEIQTEVEGGREGALYVIFPLLSAIHPSCVLFVVRPMRCDVALDGIRLTDPRDLCRKMIIGRRPNIRSVLSD